MGYEGQLLFGYKSWARMDTMVAVLGLYVIYFRQDFVLDMSVWYSVYEIVFNVIIASFTDQVSKEVMDQMIPDAPGQSKELTAVILIVLWVVARCIQYVLKKKFPQKFDDANDESEKN